MLQISPNPENQKRLKTTKSSTSLKKQNLPLISLQSNQKDQHEQEVIQKRIKKHRQIMKIVNSYKRLPEDVLRLQKMKRQTQIQINCRFMNSKHNQQYKFPFSGEQLNQSTSDQQNQNINCNHYTLYDLHEQNQIPIKALSLKTLTLDSKRRVKSLERSQMDENVIKRSTRRPVNGIASIKRIISKKPQQFIERDESDLQLMNKKNSLTDRKDRRRVGLKLPQIASKQKSGKKKINLGEIIGRKIMTEVLSPDRKTNNNSIKLNKYLKITEPSHTKIINKQPFLKDY